jgi:hypothetical protein
MYMKNAYKIISGNFEYGRPRVRPRRRREDIQKWALLGCGLNLSGFGQGPMAGLCEYNKEVSESMQDEKIPD